VQRLFFIGFNNIFIGIDYFFYVCLYRIADRL
jgi:hypothetical protein